MKYVFIVLITILAASCCQEKDRNLEKIDRFQNCFPITIKKQDGKVNYFLDTLPTTLRDLEDSLVSYLEKDQELIHQLNQDEKISIDQLVMHQNLEISNLVTNVLMDEEKYSLSNWERKEVFVTGTAKILPKLVSDAILNLRRVLIEEKIKEILEVGKQQNTTPDLEEITNYTGLKKRLFEKLNRVI